MVATWDGLGIANLEQEPPTFDKEPRSFAYTTAYGTGLQRGALSWNALTWKLPVDFDHRIFDQITILDLIK